MGGSGVAVGGGGGAGVALGVTAGVPVGGGGLGVVLGVIVDVTVGEGGAVGTGEDDVVIVGETLTVGVAVAVDAGLAVALGVGGRAVPVALTASGSRVGTRDGTCQAEQAVNSPINRIRHNVDTRPILRAIAPPGALPRRSQTLNQIGEDCIIVGCPTQAAFSYGDGRGLDNR
jgi:hypothetical protein